MPAVELSRLREQLARLTPLFDRPADYRRALVSLCEAYADSSFRSGPSANGPVLVPVYRLPPLVIRQLEMDLIVSCRLYPESALAIADVLWTESHAEPRLLGAMLLGQIPLSQADGILERLRAWASPAEDRQMLESLLTRATARLRAEGPDVLLELYGEWLNSTSAPWRALGIKALLSLISDPSYENLPPVFNLLFPLVRSAPQSLFNDLSLILTALAERTSTETAYFLRQVLASPTGKDTPRLVRRILPYLSESQQESLKSALNSRSGSSPA